MHLIVSVIVSLWLTVTILPQTNGELIVKNFTCPEEYPSCNCEEKTDKAGLSVSCNYIPIDNLQAAFSQLTARDLASFSLTIGHTETSPIPVDFLGTSRASKLSIACVRSFKLSIDDNAFRSSKSLTNEIRIENCDLKKQPNFEFLDGFTALTRFSVFGSKNFHSFQGLTSHKLSAVSITFSSGFESLADEPNIALPRLRILDLSNNDLDDVLTAKILKILAESSKKSLENLDLSDNKLTRIPEVTSSFTKLNRLTLERNAITSIKTKSFDFSGLVKFFHFDENSISSIEPNAFGAVSYSGGLFYMINMQNNNLTRMNSYVFQPMLERMADVGFGSLTLSGNPIQCDCHLAWLIVHNRKLLPVIDGGVCSNSTSFNDLNPNDLSDCPVFTCPDGIDGNFLNPLSCSSYYNCSVGKSVLVECAEGSVFSPHKQVCDSSKTALKCKIASNP